MKVIKLYQDNTGNVTDGTGLSLGCYPNLEEASSDSKDIIELVKLGLTADDIIKLKQQGLLQGKS
jgi:hypothetical protein